jgi:hypothetical protein
MGNLCVSKKKPSSPAKPGAGNPNNLPPLVVKPVDAVPTAPGGHARAYIHVCAGDLKESSEKKPAPPPDQKSERKLKEKSEKYGEAKSEAKTADEPDGNKEKEEGSKKSESKAASKAEGASALNKKVAPKKEEASSKDSVKKDALASGSEKEGK